MKKCILALVLFSICLVQYAQDTIKTKLYYRVFVGLSFSAMADFKPYQTGYKSDFSPSVRVGLPIGFGVEYSLYKRLGARIEILYSPKGGAFQRNDPDVVNISNNGTSSAKDIERYKMDYLEIPVLIDCKLNKWWHSASFSTGLSFNFLINSEFEKNYFTGSYSSTEENWSSYNLSGVNNFGVDFILGFDFTIKLKHTKKPRIMVGTRYARGLTKAFSVNTIDNLDSKTYYDSFIIRTGLAF